MIKPVLIKYIVVSVLCTVFIWAVVFNMVRNTAVSENSQNDGEFLSSIDKRLQKYPPTGLDSVDWSKFNMTELFDGVECKIVQRIAGPSLLVHSEPVCPESNISPEEFSKLPRLAWVIAINSDFITEGLTRLFSNINCYASQWGIPVYIEMATAMNDRHFFYHRHILALKHLPNYQYIFFSDADTLVGDSNIDLRDFISDDYDVSFTDRYIGELAANAYFVKNSVAGCEFVKRWIAWGKNETVLNNNVLDHRNYDNGDVHELILSGLQRGGWPYVPSGAFTRQDAMGNLTEFPSCNNGLYFYVGFIHCFDELITDYRRDYPKEMYYDMILWPYYKNPVRMRVFKMFSGFVRDLPRMYIACEQKGFFHLYHAGDFLYHHKRIEYLVDTTSSTICNRGFQILEPELPVAETTYMLLYSGFRNYIGCWRNHEYICDSAFETILEHNNGTSNLEYLTQFIF